MIEGLPPRRELPPEVRDRMRAAVRAGISPRRGRTLGAAAAVVVLVAGVAAAVQLVRPSGPAPVAVGGTVDRCWAAVESAGKTGQVPPRDQWTVTGSQANGDDVVTTFTVSGKPLFCETTATSVTVSDPGARPAYAGDGRTALLLYTGTGLVAGVADPAWPGIELSLPDGLGVTTSAVVPGTGQFTAFTSTDPATTTLWGGQWVPRQTKRSGPRWELPPAPAPLLTLVDRPGDRATTEGRALGECLDGLADPPADRDAYQPGGLLEDGRYRVVLGRSAEHSIACTPAPDPVDPARTAYTLYTDTFTGQSIPVRRLSVPGPGPQVPFVGIVPHAGTRMVADFGLGYAVEVPVRNGTFAMWLPAGATAVYPDGSAWVRVEDAGGASLFNGSVMMR